MALIVAGVSHTTAPIEVREKLTLTPQDAVRELALLRAIFIEVIRTIDRITRGKAGGLQQ